MLKIVEKLLEARGVKPEDLEGFLNPSLASLAAPEELPGVSAATEVILAEVIAKRKIVVFGDYDCDGISATAILTHTLQALNAEVVPFLPDRLTEGYGMSEKSVTRLLASEYGVSLVVTVDNGINSLKPIADLRAKGIKVVVTDHHLPGEQLPEADALIDPKVDSPDKLKDLCGAGVAFFLANQLVSEAKKRGIYDGPSVGGPLLVLAGLATVTDIMPVFGQNRIFVAEALRRFHAWAPLGLKELYARASRQTSERLNSKDFGFTIGPRINAAGRLASGMEALELILADDREVAREWARIVDLHNSERKTIEQDMTDEALAKVVEGASAQVIDLPNGHPGVAGIVAARVLERLGGAVPVCVLAGGHGSARAPDSLNIRDAFVACSKYLTTYGGHAAAGGFAVKPGQVDAFRAALCDYCRPLLKSAADVVAKSQEPELWITDEDITLELVDELQRLEPYGEGNPEPVFGLKGVRISDIRQMGGEGRHLSIVLANRLRAVWWSHGDLVESLRASASEPHDITFTLVASDYGERHPELRIVRID